LALMPTAEKQRDRVEREIDRPARRFHVEGGSRNCWATQYRQTRSRGHRQMPVGDHRIERYHQVLRQLRAFGFAMPRPARISLSVPMATLPTHSCAEENRRFQQLGGDLLGVVAGALWLA
jgi:hypothetical protein